MGKRFAAATVTASVVVGGFAGAAFGAPTLASAAESTTGAVSWAQDALSGLVQDGTITQDQADAVEAALDEARPERGPRGGFGHHLDLSVVADALGITVDELRAGLAEGRTVTDLAQAAGVDATTVVDAIVAEQRERLATEVADGDLTQEEADGLLARAEERATAFVDGEWGPPGGGRMRAHHAGPGDGDWSGGGGGAGTEGSSASGTGSGAATDNASV